MVREVTNTSQEFDSVIALCKSLFMEKNKDYGTAWRILRPSSITDQIFIKAQRIRTLEEKKISKINENITSEYMGIINYCVIALLQLNLTAADPQELGTNQLEILFDNCVKETKELMFAKNHDYDEAWREMRICSLTDLILMKILRVKQIEDNHGKILTSEGVKANYQDMLNYSVFALIKLGLK